MKAELGIVECRPYIRLTPDTVGERDLMVHLQSFLPIHREPSESDWYVRGDRLPGSGS